MTGSAELTGEFDLIDAIVAELGAASSSSAVLVGPGDDAAVVALPAGEALVTSVDTLVADVHFPASAAPQLIAQRALRVAVSDLAAMGATPLAAVIALVLPATTDAAWVRSLSRGFALAAEHLGCPITGGNLAAGPLSVSITVQGSMPPGQALLRSAARPGHLVWVSGPLGGAAVALQQPDALRALCALSPGDSFDEAAGQYFLPQPQLALGVALRGVASAAIDISDGLAADLGHIAVGSGVDIALDGKAIPRLAGASLEQALHGGDDYHLCFCTPVTARSQIAALAPAAVEIGVCKPGSGALWLDDMALSARGYDHFARH